jgi:hypothetical protein
MHARRDWIHPCNSLYYVWHPATFVESEVYNSYAHRRWRRRNLNSSVRGERKSLNVLRRWRVKQFVPASDSALSAIGTPSSTSPAPLPCSCMSIWVISYVSLCCAICNCSNVASLILSTAVSLFCTRTATIDTGARAECAGIVGSSVLYITENIVTSTCAYSSYCSDLPSGGFDAQCSS